MMLGQKQALRMHQTQLFGSKPAAPALPVRKVGVVCVCAYACCGIFGPTQGRATAASAQQRA